MNTQDIWKAFHDQREEFCRLHEAEVKRDWNGLTAPLAKQALGFAESLILCPTIESVQARMRQDLEGSRSFLVVADNVLSLTEKGGTEPLEARLKKSTPFYLLTSVVLEQLKGSKTTQPHLWK